jgi:hypothetical protein
MITYHFRKFYKIKFLFNKKELHDKNTKWAESVKTNLLRLQQQM